MALGTPTIEEEDDSHPTESHDYDRFQLPADQRKEISLVKNQNEQISQTTALAYAFLVSQNRRYSFDSS